MFKENVYTYQPVHMYQPDGFISQENEKVFKLKKTVDGSKQSGLAWHDRMDEVLTNLKISFRTMFIFL